MTGAHTNTPLANVRPLHRIRVLIAGADARYQRVTTFLLRQAGFVVDSCSAEELFHRLDKTRPHVVVLDASTSVGATARLRSALIERHVEVAVLLVSDRPRTRGVLHVLPKWKRGEVLIQEVERAYMRISSDEGLLRGTE